MIGKLLLTENYQLLTNMLPYSELYCWFPACKMHYFPTVWLKSYQSETFHNTYDTQMSKQVSKCVWGGWQSTCV